MEKAIECVIKEKFTSLNLDSDNISVISPKISSLTFLLRLNLDSNKISVIPPEISSLTSLQFLNLNHNKISVIPPEMCSMLTSLRELHLSYNKISAIPPEIGSLTSLQIFFLRDNKIKHIPLEIIQLRNLIIFDKEGNPIENIHPLITRFLNNLHNRSNTLQVYNDTQNVHNHTIQQGIKESILSILKDEIKNEYNEFFDLEEIVKDNILKDDIKNALIEYCNDPSELVSLNITFKDLFKGVWQRIKDKDEIKRVLNTEMKDAECMCFTGRVNRLVNSLNGFFDDIVININSSEQLSNIIIIVKDKLKKEDRYSIENHREEVRKELLERKYEEDIIEVWVGCIE